MTLIASYNVNGVTVMIGDLLLTRPNGMQDTDFPLPSLSNPSVAMDTSKPISLSGTRQKLNLIGNNLAISWSGRFLQANTFIGYLRDEFNLGIDSGDQFREVFSRYPIDDLRDVSFISYFYSNAEDRFHTCHLDAPSFDLTTATDIRVAGSGTEKFVKKLIHLEDFAVTEQVNPFFQASGHAMVLCSSFWAEEAFYGGGLSEGWGGGFEIALFFDGKFRKLSNILSIYFIAKETDTGDFDLSLMQRFMKHDYVDDWMRVHSFNGSNQNNIFYVSPVHVRARPEKLAIPDDSYDWLCAYIRVERRGGAVEHLTNVNFFHNSFQPFRIEKQSSTYTLSVHSSYVDEVLRNVRSRIANRSHS